VTQIIESSRDRAVVLIMMTLLSGPALNLLLLAISSQVILMATALVESFAAPITVLPLKRPIRLTTLLKSRIASIQEQPVWRL
jgi:hypothetical protein